MTTHLNQLDDYQRWADALASSGSYDGADARTLFPRIAHGAALDVDPITAAGNITISRGKPTFSASLLAALVERRPDLDYRVIRADDEAAEIEFSRDGKVVGTASFTIAEARRAGLTKKEVWQSYPSDLLFARAFSRGVRRFAPGLTTGSAAYTREELGEDRHEPRPDKATPAEVAPAAAPAAAPQPTATLAAPLAPDQLAELRRLKAELNMADAAWKGVLAKRNASSARELSPEQADELIAKLKHRVATRQLEEATPGGKPESLSVEVPVARKQEGEPSHGLAGFPDAGR